MYELQGHIVPPHRILKNAKDIQKIKDSSAVNMAVLDAVGEMIGAGVSTQEIDDVVSRVTTEMGAIAAPLNYEGHRLPRLLWHVA